MDNNFNYEVNDNIIKIENTEDNRTVYDVYARANAENKVEKIFSSCFEQPQETDVLIKRGKGDEYVHVGYYEVFNEDRTHKYTIENDTMRECTEDELQAERETFVVPEISLTSEERIKALEQENADLKTRLEQTQEAVDYLLMN